MVVVSVESESMSSEVSRVVVESEVGVDLLHGHVVRVQALPRLLLVLVELLHPHKELLETENSK